MSDPIGNANREIEHWWNEDDFVPVARSEFNAGMRDALAIAREHGWIPPRDKSGCDCFTCRSWRQYEASL